MDPKDRRRFPRLVINVPARIFPQEGASDSMAAEVLDLSKGGAFVHCALPIRLGQRVRLHIDFSDTKSIDGKVTAVDKLPADIKSPEIVKSSIIRWVRGSSKSGFGVEFVDLDSDHEMSLERLIGHLASLVSR